MFVCEISPRIFKGRIYTAWEGQPCTTEGGEIDDLEADVDADVGEVTITDEEAQDIIDLADKLKGAVGEEPAGDIEIEAEEEDTNS